jgi:hypothetical protein
MPGVARLIVTMLSVIMLSVILSVILSVMTIRGES